QDQMKQMQTAQDQKFAGLQMLLQQAIDESRGMTASVGGLQKTVADRLADQQSKLAAPIASLETRLDQTNDDTRAIRENMTALNTRLTAIHNKLADIATALRTLLANSAPAPPPSPNGAAAAPAPPAGVTADGLFQNAFRDFSSGKDELAMNEFNDYLKY